VLLVLACGLQPHNALTFTCVHHSVSIGI